MHRNPFKANAQQSKYSEEAQHSARHSKPKISTVNRISNPGAQSQQVQNGHNSSRQNFGQQSHNNQAHADVQNLKQISNNTATITSNQQHTHLSLLKNQNSTNYHHTNQASISPKVNGCTVSVSQLLQSQIGVSCGASRFHQPKNSCSQISTNQSNNLISQTSSKLQKHHQISKQSSQNAQYQQQQPKQNLLSKKHLSISSAGNVPYQSSVAAQKLEANNAVTGQSIGNQHFNDTSSSKTLHLSSRMNSQSQNGESSLLSHKASTGGGMSALVNGANIGFRKSSHQAMQPSVLSPTSQNFNIPSTLQSLNLKITKQTSLNLNASSQGNTHTSNSHRQQHIHQTNNENVNTANTFFFPQSMSQDFQTNEDSRIKSNNININYKQSRNKIVYKASSAQQPPLAQNIIFQEKLSSKDRQGEVSHQRKKSLNTIQHTTKDNQQQRQNSCSSDHQPQHSLSNYTTNASQRAQPVLIQQPQINLTTECETGTSIDMQQSTFHHQPENYCLQNPQPLFKLQAQHFQQEQPVSISQTFGNQRFNSNQDLESMNGRPAHRPQSSMSLQHPGLIMPVPNAASSQLKQHYNQYYAMPVQQQNLINNTIGALSTSQTVMSHHALTTQRNAFIKEELNHDKLQNYTHYSVERHNKRGADAMISLGQQSSSIISAASLSAADENIGNTATGSLLEGAVGVQLPMSKINTATSRPLAIKKQKTCTTSQDRMQAQLNSQKKKGSNNSYSFTLAKNKDKRGKGQGSSTKEQQSSSSKKKRQPTAQVEIEEEEKATQTPARKTKAISEDNLKSTIIDREVHENYSDSLDNYDNCSNSDESANQDSSFSGQTVESPEGEGILPLLEGFIKKGELESIKQFQCLIKGEIQKALIYRSIEHRQVEMLKYLLTAENLKLKFNLNLLHIACRQRDNSQPQLQLEIVKTILKHDPFANINSQDTYGNTPLHLAAQNSKQLLLEYFLRKLNPNIYIKNSENQLALHSSTSQDILKIFVSHIQRMKDNLSKQDSQQDSRIMSSNRGGNNQKRLSRNKSDQQLSSAKKSKNSQVTTQQTAQKTNNEILPTLNSNSSNKENDKYISNHAKQRTSNQFNAQVNEVSKFDVGCEVEPKSRNRINTQYYSEGLAMQQSQQIQQLDRYTDQRESSQQPHNHLKNVIFRSKTRDREVQQFQSIKDFCQRSNSNEDASSHLRNIQTNQDQSHPSRQNQTHNSQSNQIQNSSQRNNQSLKYQEQSQQQQQKRYLVFREEDFEKVVEFTESDEEGSSQGNNDELGADHQGGATDQDFYEGELNLCDEIREVSDEEFQKSLKLMEAKIGPKSFEPLSLLGQGSFGEVYLVRMKDSKQLYAMKVLQKQKIMGQNLVKYAITERNVLSYTRHPFIVGLNYAFQTRDKLFLILDYCPGGDLGKVITKERRLTEERARIYLSEVLLALEDLHSRNIIFRDLKPDNVVLDADGHALLTDFGLSKEGVLDNQASNSFCGSVAYLAPEMIRRSGHGKSVDWYLLGVLLYEMLVGIPPYFNQNREKLFQGISKGPLLIPAQFSDEAKTLLIGLLNKNPAKRLGSGPRGAEEIKEHPFFKQIQWDQVYQRQLNPPKPAVKDLKQLELPYEKMLEVLKQSVYGDQLDDENKVAGWSFVAASEKINSHSY